MAPDDPPNDRATDRATLDGDATAPAPGAGPSAPDGDAADETAAWADLAATLPQPPGTVGADRPSPDDPDVARPGGRAARLARFARDLADEATAGAGVPEPAPGEPPESFARRLVRDGRLTGYQAAAVLQGKTRGLVIGNYVVLDRLGAGGMGMVFKARHRKLGKVVALKVLPPSFGRDRAAVLRFRREARAAARLGHPNVVTAIDADEFHGLNFLVMEYVDGCDLARLVREGGPLPVGRAVGYVAQAARGLRAAHAEGIVHRDVKPSNLLVDAAGTVKISDLGLARVAGAAERIGGADDAGLTRDGAMMGTVDFMPPEQAYDARLADERSDVYGLGCTLYYLLTGAPPYPAETVVGRLLAHREAPVPSARESRPDVPPALDAVLARMMAKEPGDRYPTVEALADDLDALLTSGSLPAGPPATRPQPTPGVVPPTVVSPRARDRGAGPETFIDRVDVSPPPRRPPVSRPVKIVAAAVLGLSAFAVVFDRNRPKFGALVIQGDGVPVSVREFGRVVVPATDRRTLSLLPGDYEIVPEAAPGAYVAVPPHVSITRGGRAVVNVRAVPGPPPRRPLPRPAPPASVATPSPAPAPPAGIDPDEAGPPGLVRTLRHGGGAVEAVAVSDDGRRAVSGGNDGMLRVWDLATGEPVGSIANGAPVRALAVSNDGRRALSASADRTARLWDLDARREEARLGGGPDPGFGAVALSRDGRALVGGTGGMAGLYDARDLAPRELFPHGSRVNAVALVPGGPLALVGGDGATVDLWETGHAGDTQLTRAKPTRFETGGRVLCLAVSGDGRRALTGGDNGALVLLDLDARTVQARLTGGPRDWVRCVGLLPDGRRALAGYQGGKLLLWDLSSGQVAHAFDPTPDGHLGLAPLPDGLHALTADEDGLLRLWRLPKAANQSP